MNSLWLWVVVAQLPTLAQELPAVEEAIEQFDEEAEWDEGTVGTEGTVDDPAALQTETNPLNPVGDSIDALIELRINDDVSQPGVGVGSAEGADVSGLGTVAIAAGAGEAVGVRE